METTQKAYGYEVKTWTEGGKSLCAAFDAATGEIAAGPMNRPHELRVVRVRSSAVLEFGPCADPNTGCALKKK